MTEKNNSNKLIIAKGRLGKMTSTIEIQETVKDSLSGGSDIRIGGQRFSSSSRFLEKETEPETLSKELIRAWKPILRNPSNYWKIDDNDIFFGRDYWKMWLKQLLTLEEKANPQYINAARKKIDEAMQQGKEKNKSLVQDFDEFQVNLDANWTFVNFFEQSLNIDLGKHRNFIKILLNKIENKSEDKKNDDEILQASDRIEAILMTYQEILRILPNCFSREVKTPPVRSSSIRKYGEKLRVKTKYLKLPILSDNEAIAVPISLENDDGKTISVYIFLKHITDGRFSRWELRYRDPSEKVRIEKGIDFALFSNLDHLTKSEILDDPKDDDLTITSKLDKKLRTIFPLETNRDAKSAIFAFAPGLKIDADNIKKTTTFDDQGNFVTQ